LEFEDLIKLSNPIVNIGSGQNPKQWLAFNALPLEPAQSFSVPVFASLANEDSALLEITVEDAANFEGLMLSDQTNNKNYWIQDKFAMKFHLKHL
jgi:hypothetical protein